MPNGQETSSQGETSSWITFYQIRSNKYEILRDNNNIKSLVNNNRFIQNMRPHTPTTNKSKSPFAINRKSQIADNSPTTSTNSKASVFLGGNKENTQSTFNNFLSSICKLSKSRPMVEVQGGGLLDASLIFNNKERERERDRERQIDSSFVDTRTTKKLEMELHRKNNMIKTLQSKLEASEDLAHRLEAEKQSMGDAFAMMQSEILNTADLNQKLNSENMVIKRQVNQKVTELTRAQEQIQELRANLEVYQTLDPRLKQLEELQDTLIEENAQLKKEKERYVGDLKAVIKNIKAGANLDSEVLEAILSSM